MRAFARLSALSENEPIFFDRAADFLLAFFLIATRSLDPTLRRRARAIGHARGRLWTERWSTLKDNMDCTTALPYLIANYAVGGLGIPNFTAHDEIGLVLRHCSIQDLL